MKRKKLMLVAVLAVLIFCANNTYSQTSEPLVFDEIVAIKMSSNVTTFYLQFTNKSGKSITAFQGAIFVVDDFGKIEARSDFSIPSSTQYHNAGENWENVKTLKAKGGIPSGESFVLRRMEGYGFSDDPVHNPILSMEMWCEQKSEIVDFREYLDMGKYRCTVSTVAFADGSVWKRK